VHLVADCGPALSVKHSQEHCNEGHQAEKAPIVIPALYLPLPLVVNYAQDLPGGAVQLTAAAGLLYLALRIEHDRDPVAEKPVE
jgi:hypothetical protein